ncbi:MAG TPA: thioredoxin [Romboutsia timonensis]|uniref:Thioredoxin n=1 Tax=Romboutsia timonensis TaxID=1776391 RepID=A0A921N083_9FIRM|nr:thioredoxin [uncultured Romboutsia sp.]HJG95939.1 thioredoxin [Romboutsia timonensis]
MAQVINSEEFNNLVENTEGIAVVDFFATWCGPCKMLAPVFQEVGNEFEEKADFYKVDIDESLDIARQFSVSTVPTVIIFRNGEPIERLVGFMPKENLAAKIKEYI